MKKSCIVTLPLIALYASQALPLKANIAGADASSVHIHELDTKRVGVWQSLINWLKVSYQIDLKQDRDKFKTLLNSVVSQDFERIFGESSAAVIAKLYSEVVDEPYPQEPATIVQEDEQTIGKPLSEIIERYLALLSSEELKHLDVSVRPAVGQLEAPEGTAVDAQKISNPPVWSLDEQGNAIFTDSNGKQFKVPSPEQVNPFELLVTSPDKIQVWAIDKNDGIYYRLGVTSIDPMGTAWILIRGKLKHVVITPDNIVWGINANGLVFVTSKNTDAEPTGLGWLHIPGELLSSINVDGNGEITGITLDGRLLKRIGVNVDNPRGDAWEAIS